jgi:hypothetical protein
MRTPKPLTPALTQEETPRAEAHESRIEAVRVDYVTISESRLRGD